MRQQGAGLGTGLWALATPTIPHSAYHSPPLSPPLPTESAFQPGLEERRQQVLLGDALMRDRRGLGGAEHEHAAPVGHVLAARTEAVVLADPVGHQAMVRVQLQRELHLPM